MNNTLTLQDFLPLAGKGITRIYLTKEAAAAFYGTNDGLFSTKQQTNPYLNGLAGITVGIQFFTEDENEVYSAEAVSKLTDLSFNCHVQAKCEDCGNEQRSVIAAGRSQTRCFKCDSENCWVTKLL